MATPLNKYSRRITQVKFQGASQAMLFATGMSEADLSEETWTTRRARWTAPPLKVHTGTLYKYIRLVRSASEGCVTDR